MKRALEARSSVTGRDEEAPLLNAGIAQCSGGVDLAKHVIQVSVLSPSTRELRNSALIRCRFAGFLSRQRPSLVAFEACATAHYRAGVAQRHGR